VRVRVSLRARFTLLCRAVKILSAHSRSATATATATAAGGGLIYEYNIRVCATVDNVPILVPFTGHVYENAAASALF